MSERADRERPRGDQWRPDYTDASGRQADPYEIVDAILGELESYGYDVDEDSYRESLKALDWRDRGHRNAIRERFQEDGGFEEPILPGFGQQGRARTAKGDCGDPHPFICDCCGRCVEFGRTCAMSVCARCAPVWNRDLAANKAAKVRRLRIRKQRETPGQGNDDEWQKIHHLSISPPLGWYRDLAAAGLSLQEAQDVTQDIVKSILAELRAQGVLVRHSFRGADDNGLNDEYDDRGLWKERLYHQRDWHGDVRGDLAWKPHYHAVVVADRIHVTNEPEDPDHRPNLSTVVERETGWSIHRIEGRDGKKSIEDDGQMARVLTYALSHADIRRNVGANDNNQSQVWTVGSFHEKTVASHEDFVARDSDIDWAAAKVRDAAEDVLGLQSASTDCNASIPGVDDPDELARRIIEDLYPGDDDRDVPEDVVLHHVSEGNIRVNVSTTSGGGGDVTVTDAFGEPIRGDGFSGSIPDVAGSTRYDGADGPAAVDALQEDRDEGHEDDHEHGSTSSTSDDEDDECGGSMIPLGEARERGLLEDPEWCKQAPRVDEAREADREWGDDLPAWNVDSPGDAAPPTPAAS